MTPKERPILFSGDEVRAILNGTKTQTRRPIKPQPGPQAYVTPFEGGWTFGGLIADISAKYRSRLLTCPFGSPGDVLWVRETWGDRADYSEFAACRQDRVYYAADGKKSGWKYRPSIHMPRWASRITLEVVSVRAQRVQEITDSDIAAEGVTPDIATDHSRGPWFTAWAELWKSIYGRESFDANEWVWAGEFRRVKP